MTGWAILDTDPQDAFSIGNSLSSGVKNFSLSGDEHPSLRAWTAGKFFAGMIKGCDAVYYELARPRQGSAWPRIFYGLEALLHAACREINVIPETASPAQVKWAALGKGMGRAGKAPIVSMARAQWPEQKIKDDNQADALWLLKLAADRENADIGNHVGELDLNIKRT